MVHQSKNEDLTNETHQAFPTLKVDVRFRHEKKHIEFQFTEKIEPFLNNVSLLQDNGQFGHAKSRSLTSFIKISQWALIGYEF